MIASKAYLAEIADEFLAALMSVGWSELAKAGLKGETTWIDARSDQPGVEVETNFHLRSDSIEIEVVAYQPNEDGEPIVSARRVGTVRP
jgi:hypothetical protein